jgi:hypothetical protein
VHRGGGRAGRSLRTRAGLRSQAYILDTPAQLRNGLAEAVQTQREAVSDVSEAQAKRQGYLDRLKEFEAALKSHGSAGAGATSGDGG